MSIWTRREVCRAALAGMIAAQPIRTLAQGPSTAPARRSDDMIISLNTSTLRGHKLPITELIDIAAEAGYRGIEPWPDDLEKFVAAGGSLRDLRKRLDDRGLAVTGAIAFSEWMVDDESARRKAHESTRRTLETLSQIGATHMAAPPAGDVASVSLLAAAERYRAMLELAEPFNVVPAVEVWGFAPNLYRLGQVVMVAMEADHPRACILPDVYHLYKGGSGFSGVRHIAGRFYGGFHLNDIPHNPPPREQLTDAHRVYPGDGIAPLVQIVRDLRSVGYTGPLSVELFNPEYYRQGPRLVARTAFEKTQTIVQAASV
jgi:2-keto-myo-inositol isomerase